MKALLRTRVLRLLLLCVLLYVALCTVLYLMQDRLLFPAAGVGKGRELPLVPGVRLDWLKLDDSVSVRVAVAEHARPRAWMVFFCGNGEDLRSGMYRAELWRAYGNSAVVAEYPGYGDSGGAPTEESLQRVARAAAELARAGAARDGVPLLVAGASLGSYPAVQLAADGIGEKLLLLAPFTSARDVAVSRYWFLPVRWLMRHPLDNLARAAEVGVPVLVVHGDLDGVVPVESGQALATALRARFVLAPGCGHNDLPLEPHGPFGAELRRFMHGE